MTALRFQFVTGRWHATAWGNHVNEGVPDWPPAPWRICRALIATWFHKFQAVIDEGRVRSLIETLATVAPSYALPSATAAHTRHYMPVNSGKAETRTKIFDTFVHVAAGQALTVLWPVQLDPAQRELLAMLLGGMNYFGRAESLVEATLLPQSASLPESSARPLGEGESLLASEEPVRLLVPETPSEYGVWLGRQTPPGKKPKGKARTALPGSVFDALLADTGDLKAAGWSQPPGSRWIDFARPSEPFRIAPQRVSTPTDRRPTVARFAIVSDVPPRITQALSLGERFHRALVSRCDSPVFTGLNGEGKPLQGNHQHAYYLSECNPQDGYVRYLTIYARMGFDPDARRALEQLRQTWGYDGHKVQLILVGIGDREDFTGPAARVSNVTTLDSATDWVSITPFVPTRHRKTRHNGEPKRDADGLEIGSPEHDLRRLMAMEGLPKPIEMTPLAFPGIRRRLRWLQYQRVRKYGEGGRAGERGYGFRVRFAEPVQGPLAFGYGAHFGLGLFVPASNA